MPLRWIIRGCLMSTALNLLTWSAWAQDTAAPYLEATRYDGAQRIVGIIQADPDGSGPRGFLVKRYSYDAAGRLTTSEKGELANWQSDAVAPKDWNGLTITSRVDIEYDSRGRIKTQRISSSNKILAASQFNYNYLGKVECTATRMNISSLSSLPLSACEMTGGNVSTPDRISRNTYSATGLLIKVQQAYGVENLQQDYATYSYSPNGNRLNVKDANGNLASFTYDGFDRQSAWYFPSVTSPGISNNDDYEAYGYDANGNRTSLRRRDGRVLTFSYDALNRLVTKSIPDGCPPIQTGGCPDAASTQDVFYGYDLRGLQTTAKFATSFDDAKRLDADGVTIAYDGFGRIISSTTQMGGVARTVSASYDANGNRTKLTTPGGSWTYGYDGLDRLINLYEGAATGPVMSSWTYNSQGLRQSVAERYGSGASWDYDGEGRLTSQSDYFVGDTGNTKTTLDYNPANQIEKRGRSNASYTFNDQYNVNRSYQPNGLNQYNSSGENGLYYDANGNLIREKKLDTSSVAYTYDAENRLVKRDDDSLIYDPLGRLFQVSTALGGVTQFLYDGDQLVGEYDRSGTLSNTYVHGPGDDDPLLWYPNGEPVRWYHQDSQGSIIATATGPSGTLQVINTYDEYGIRGSGNVGRFQFTGQIWLPEFGLYHYKARAYSPMLGRFLQADPIGYNDQVNLYAYVANDPVNGRDPKGTETCVNNGNGTQTCSSNGSILDNAALGLRVIYETAKYGIGSILNNDASSKPEEQAPRPLTDGERKGLSEAGTAPDRGGRTAAGRAGEKHGSRPGSAFPPTKGTPADINKQGQKTLEGIVKNPGSTVEVDDRGRTTVTSPDGRGARYNPDGSLQGFREPEPKLRD